MVASGIEPSGVSDAPDFDSLAGVYCWMEYLSFGPMLKDCRFYFLDHCASVRTAIVLGDGDGRFTARLLATNSNVQVDAVDSSVAMLAELHRRAAHKVPSAGARLQTIHADLRRFTPNRNGYDLVVSHFFLDCLTDEEVAALVERMLQHLTPGATWLVSEFAIPEKGWRRVLGRVLVGFLYFAFNKMTNLQVRQIPDYAKILIRYGFRRQRQVRFLGGLLVAEVWKLTEK